MELAELKQAVRAADPAALLVSPRVLRRILQEEFKVPHLLVQAPHERCYFFDRELLFRHVEQDELEVEPDCLLPSTVVLLSRPSAEDLEKLSRDALLSKYWRLLFHVHVHLALVQKQREGGLTPAEVRERVAQIGRTEFEEIRTVLHEEKDLLPPKDDLDVYVEFAAIYLELRYFRTNLRATYFPAIRDFQVIDLMLARDVDADAIFAKTRLPGASDPVICTDTSSDESHDYYWRLLRHAERALTEGDIVRAAILHTKAARVAPAAATQSTRAMAIKDMEQLTSNLQDALKFSAEEAGQWHQVLPALLDKSDQGNWPVEAKLLYDLQEVCMEHQRKSFALDVVEWAVSAGRRPIKRPLNSLQLVRTTQHIRAAALRLTMARVSDDDRQRLARLLQSAQRLSEERMRERFRPMVNDALHDVGLLAANPPEQVALEKVIEELLDRIVEYGFFTFSDLRDTISRNQLKLPDLQDPYSYWRGDPLLRLDRRLATLMEGVYRRGEFYLRWLERSSSLFFGTDVGRFITRNFLLPFGGAFALIFTLQVLYADYLQPTAAAASSKVVEERRVAADILETVKKPADAARPPAPEVGGEAKKQAAKKDTEKQPEEPDDLGKQLVAAEPEKPAPPARNEPAVVRSDVFPWWTFLPVGIFIWAFMHIPSFREFFFQASHWTYAGLRLVLYEIPLAIWQTPWVKKIFTSWPFLLLYWYGLKPLAVSAAIWMCWPWSRSSVVTMAATFFSIDLFLNVRFGYAFSEAVVGMVAMAYGWVRFEFFKGIIRWIDSFFRQIIKAMESVLYSVEEWLRFRSDESRLTLVIRAVAGVIWFPIGYLIRLYFVTLMEPTLNPIKLPLSSLAFKFMLILPIYQEALRPSTHLNWLAPHVSSDLATVLAFGFIVPTVWLFPGVVAFFLWEMQANWRMFRANRSALLKPVVIGSHGERMLQLLRPGIHSGTIPKLFSHLRHAELSAYQDNDWRAARTYRQALREVARTLQLFIEREFIALLRQSRTWPNPPIWVAQIVLSCNRVRVELGHREYDNQSLWLAFEEHDGWLIASIPEPGWTRHLNAEQRQVLTSALAGLYKIGGVHLVRNGSTLAYDAAGDSYDFFKPQQYNGVAPGHATRPDPKELSFFRLPITWTQWVACWEHDHEGKGHPHLLPESLLLLPAEPGHKFPELSIQRVT